MRAGRGRILGLVLGLLACVVPAVPTLAQADSTGVDLAIAPFANNTGQSAVHTQLMPVLAAMLQERGWHTVTSDSLRPLLRQYRVRSRGWISRRGANLIAEATSARWLMLGSWDVLQPTGSLEFGVSLRLLDLQTKELVGAVSVGNSGEDHVRWLDKGRVSDIDLLVRSVLAQALDELRLQLEPGQTKLAASRAGRLAVVPLDNFAATADAGNIVTNILLSRLLAAGYTVVEPGFVRELGLAREVVSRGGVDRASARAIRDSLGAGRVITGAVQEFAPARGAATVSVPRFAAGLRVSSTRLGTLLAATELEQAGNDHDGVFQLGRVHAITPLVTAQIDKFVAGLPSTSRKDSTDGPQDN